MKLSEHLSLNEMISSNTAKRNGINNAPTDVHLSNMKMLAEKIFEPIRKHFNQPIHISSGYRSKALNKAIGGAATSAHCFGLAIDIDMDGKSDTITNRMIFDWVKSNLKFDQLIFEYGDKENPDWVHVGISLDMPNRNQVLRATRIKGKTVYTPYED